MLWLGLGMDEKLSFPLVGHAITLSFGVSRLITTHII